MGSKGAQAGVHLARLRERTCQRGRTYRWSFHPSSALSRRKTKTGEERLNLFVCSSLQCRDGAAEKSFLAYPSTPLGKKP